MMTEQQMNQVHSDALDVLGRCYEKGLGVEKDFELALEHYSSSFKMGSMFAAFDSAELPYKSNQGPESGSLPNGSGNDRHVISNSECPVSRAWILLQQRSGSAHGV